VCGAEAAARRYFGVRADVLTPQQAAWLAAMLHDPELEAGRWASTGQINVALTQWVLQGMHTLPPRQRQRLIQDVAKVKWKVPTPKPPPKPKR
jgi:membrane peptidoglycan carboxypeptidase